VFTEEQQAARAAAVAVALSAYDNRDRTAAFDEQWKPWEALWEACDFSAFSDQSGSYPQELKSLAHSCGV
jgi:hypothetical protein